MGQIQIVEVKTKSDLRTFADLPNRMYRDNPYYVPNFYSDELADWDPNKNPALEYCEARAFLAWKDGVPAGRVGAILSHRANQKWNTRNMRFSQLDFIDDEDVSRALLETVECWAKEKGCTAVHGPLGFCDLDREGLLVEGFEETSLFFTYYNLPYYREHLEKLGYQKDTDWIEYQIQIPKETDPIYQRISKASDMILKKGEYHKADMSKRSKYRQYVRAFFALVNEAYADLYGTVELTQKQIDKYADKFIPLINPDYLCLLLDENEQLAAFGVCCPSVSEALRKCRGRLFPFGWTGVLKALRKNNVINLLLIAVRPELQRKGLNAVVIDHIMKSCIKNGIQYAETGPQLETNKKMTNQWRLFDTRQHKRRRCFRKELSPAAQVRP